MYQRLMPQIPFNDCKKIYAEIVKIGNILNKEYIAQHTTTVDIKPIINLDVVGRPSVDVNLLVKIPRTQELSGSNLVIKNPVLKEDIDNINNNVNAIHQEIDRLNKRYDIRPNIIWKKVYNLITDQVL